jgi:hypothetical protein
MSELCSMRSRAVGEPIAGTAVAKTAVWIVLEHRAPWGAKAVAESNLPAAVKARLFAWEAEIPGARVQLVRRHGRVDGPLRFWVGVADLGASRLVAHTLGSPEELLQLDAPAIVNTLREGRAVEGGCTPTLPLLLVCTNGRRDLCCAKLGAPVAQALAQQDGLEVWQTTHLGGHRFAATLLQLPEGLCYGRLEAHEAPALAEAVRQRRVYRLDRLRGRTALSAAAQAAEVAWRERTGQRELHALVRVEEAPEGEGTVVTLHDREGQAHVVRLEHRALGTSAPSSCGTEPAAVMAWRPAGGAP